MDLSLIIPCYNEEANVELFFETTELVFAGRDIDYEYVFVNDGSGDATKEKLRAVFENNKKSNITVVNFSRNFGKEAAIYAGLKNSAGEYSCIIDADMQQRPEVALEMYNTIINDRSVDCVCAFQKIRKEGSLMTFVKSSFYKIINKVAETKFQNGASDFRLFNKKVKNAVLSLSETNRFSKGLFSWVGFNTYYMEYKAEERNSGESKWSPFKLLKYGIGGILSFSNAPLAIPTYSGIFLSASSVLALIVVLITKAIKPFSVDIVWYFLLLMMFFTGLVLFSIGIIGEYIGRIFQEAKNRPIYIASEILKRKDENE